MRLEEAAAENRRQTEIIRQLEERLSSRQVEDMEEVKGEREKEANKREDRKRGIEEVVDMEDYKKVKQENKRLKRTVRKLVAEDQIVPAHNDFKKEEVKSEASADLDKKPD